MSSVQRTFLALLAACLLAIALMPACAAPPPAELRGAWVSADACMEPAAMDALLNRRRRST